MSALVTSEGSLLVTGFEPFGGRSRNRSWEVVRRIAPRPGLETLQLPVNYARLREIIPGLASRGPRCVLLLGESSTWTAHVEQVAVNTLNRNLPDNSGAKPLSDTIIADGPQSLQASWDAQAVARKLNECGIAATASFHAGRYACNAALYLALHALGARATVGFLHVPRRRWPIGIWRGRLLRAVDICLEALRDAQPGAATDDRVGNVASRG
jgi:pyroglutamyl-peptidase